MPRTRGIHGLPRDHVIGGQWPDADLEGPVAVHYAQAVARRLRHAVAGRSLRQIARDADVSSAVLLRVLAGTTWPGLVTLAKLEAALGTALWPGPGLAAEVTEGDHGRGPRVDQARSSSKSPQQRSQ